MPTDWLHSIAVKMLASGLLWCQNAGMDCSNYHSAYDTFDFAVRAQKRTDFIYMSGTPESDEAAVRRLNPECLQLGGKLILLYQYQMADGRWGTEAICVKDGDPIS